MARARARAHAADQPDDHRTGAGAVVSVVVPAHDEARVVARCLTSLTGGPAAEVVVVANGCSDGTASVAAAVPGTHVVVTDVASKPAALTAGDEAATVFPRIYLDADVELLDGALDELVAALDVEQARVASPRPRFDVTGCSWVVRSWYRVFARLPYVEDGPVGLGVYALNEAGRARWGAFPDVTNDDLFVERHFAPHERVSVDAEFVVRAPRTLPDLLAVRTRVARGNLQLARAHGPDSAFATTTSSTVRTLVDLVRRRRVAPWDVLVYMGVIVLARRRGRSGADVWYRDASTR